MSFRDDVQLARACEALCSRIRKGACWVLTPSPSATTFAIDVKEGRACVSTGERLIVMTAWAFWNGCDQVSFARLLDVLSVDHLEAIFGLAVAAIEGPDAVDVWLAKHERLDHTRQGARKAGAL
jgi:hypothetical protein